MTTSRTMPLAACPGCGTSVTPDARFCHACGAPIAQACGACGAEIPSGSAFCPACGAAQHAATPRPPADRGRASAQERKVVSVLFVDLVSSTEAAEGADPEDVRTTLSAYHGRVRGIIEHFGGTVEKFVGDAVMAVFGAPILHEDDAERAVRAALIVLEDIALNNERTGATLAVRAAVNTGEAVVDLGARAAFGEALVAGDVVNTAARLQGVAPAGSTVVGGLTWRLTRDVIDYDELPPVRVKGKSGEVPLWRAVGPRARLGVDVRRNMGTPLVGRQVELSQLQSAFQRALRESATQFVTVAGEPGVGKTRLVAELLAWADKLPQTVVWRQGRSLPYGDGVTYWALGEIVKSHAGVLDSDTHTAAAAKLATALTVDVESHEDRRWLQSRLEPLIGVKPAQPASVDRTELFTAWRRFLEMVSGRDPAVVVFDDIHWADDALLDFLEYLCEYAVDSRMLVVFTARPELYERRAAWGGGLRNATTVSLSPLTAQETGRLVDSLLAQRVLTSATRRVLLDRAGGNPLFAEEFVRMIVDRLPTGEETRNIPVPDSVQALIAARIDTLPSERKVLLQDASVVGKVFWAGAVAHMSGRDRHAVETGLHELVRKELVRQSRQSTIAGETEYAFWHALGQEVAYRQIPRVERARKHRDAAQWIERTVAERLADHAELLAHHWGEALQLAKAAHDDELTGSLRKPAARVFTLAAEHASTLDPIRAQGFWEAALALLAKDDPRRARTLHRLAETAFDAGTESIGSCWNRFDEAIALLAAQGDDLARGDALTTLSRIQGNAGETAAGRGLLGQALHLLERHPPSLELARALTHLAATQLDDNRPADSLATVERTLPLAERLGAGAELVRLHLHRGNARLRLSDPAGLGDQARALALSQELGLTEPRATAYNNYGYASWYWEGPRAGGSILREGVAFAEDRGQLGAATFLRGNTCLVLYDEGDWDELLVLAAATAARDRAANVRRASVDSDRISALVLSDRGRLGEAARVAADVLATARVMQEPETLFPALCVAAEIARVSGRLDEAVALVEEFLRYTDRRPRATQLEQLGCVWRVCLAAGDAELAASVVQVINPVAQRAGYGLLDGQATVARIRGDHNAAAGLYARAADGWRSFNCVPQRADSLHGAARCLQALGRCEAAGTLKEAQDISTLLGATKPAADL